MAVQHQVYCLVMYSVVDGGRKHVQTVLHYLCIAFINH